MAENFSKKMILTEFGAKAAEVNGGGYLNEAGFGMAADRVNEFTNNNEKK